MTSLSNKNNPMRVSLNKFNRKMQNQMRKVNLTRTLKSMMKMILTNKNKPTNPSDKG